MIVERKVLIEGVVVAHIILPEGVSMEDTLNLLGIDKERATIRFIGLS